MNTIEVITGGMQSGKSEELIRRIRRAIIAKLRVAVFTPLADTRSGSKIVSRAKSELDAIPITSRQELLGWMKKLNPQVVCFDEIHLFGGWFPETIMSLLHGQWHVRIIVAGLAADAWRKPFRNTTHLMAIADKIDLYQAICTQCGQPAVYTQKKSPVARARKVVSPKKQRIEIGGDNLYEGRCRLCHTLPD